MTLASANTCSQIIRPRTDLNAIFTGLPDQVTHTPDGMNFHIRAGF
jgi:hypothetical protein